MLNIITEYRKGILFVRFNGKLNKKTVKRISTKFIPFIKEDNIDNIVLNFLLLKEIDLKGISFLYQVYEVCKSNNGNLFICNMNVGLKEKLKKYRILNYLKELQSETESFSLIGG